MSRMDLPIGARFREFFLLDRAERVVQSLTPTQSRGMRAYYDAGMRRLRVAQDLRGPEEVQASLSLYRHAILFLAQAALLSRDEQAQVAELSVSAALDQVGTSLRSELPADLPELVTVLSSTDPLLFDRLAAEEAGQKAEKLERLAEWLAAQIEPRSPQQLRVTRALRVGTAALVVLGLLSWAIVRMLAPANVAKGKPAVASTVAFTSSADAVVNGVKEGTFGLHTELQPDSSVTIDLGGNHAISRIVVFGRGDCCFDQSIPFNLELSSDGVTFQKIGQRTEPLGQADPWIVHADGAVARHVRLRTERTAFLVLSEVEVYGKPRK